MIERKLEDILSHLTDDQRQVWIAGVIENMDKFAKANQVPLGRVRAKWDLDTPIGQPPNYKLDLC